MSLVRCSMACDTRWLSNVSPASNTISADSDCALQYGLQSEQPVIAADGSALDMEVGCVHQHDIGGCGWLRGHGRSRRLSDGTMHAMD
jgi:hypothetical protein